METKLAKLNSYNTKIALLENKRMNIRGVEPRSAQLAEIDKQIKYLDEERRYHRLGMMWDGEKTCAEPDNVDENQRF